MSVLIKRMAAAFAAAILSAIGGIALLYGPEYDWKPAPILAVATALVVVATVIGTLRLGQAGLVVGPLLGAAPLSIIVWFGVDLTADAQSGIVGFTVAFGAFFVSITSWGLALLLTHKRRAEGIWPKAT